MIEKSWRRLAGAKEMADDERDIVRLMTAQNPAEAHVTEQALRDAGIECQVVGDYLDAGIGDIPGFRAEVWVHRNDLAAAENILREHARKQQEEGSNESEA